MTTVKIKGMRCGHCVASVTKALAEIDGITNVQVDLEKGEATFEESKPVEPAKIKNVIIGIGFDAE
jgi:copper chaperone